MSVDREENGMKTAKVILSKPALEMLNAGKSITIKLPDVSIVVIPTSNLAEFDRMFKSLLGF
jgi:hypothetical protein